MVLTEQKLKSLEKLSDENGIISALAFDQRGALKRLYVIRSRVWSSSNESD